MQSASIGLTIVTLDFDQRHFICDVVWCAIELPADLQELYVIEEGQTCDMELELTFQCKRRQLH